MHRTTTNGALAAEPGRDAHLRVAPGSQLLLASAEEVVARVAGREMRLTLDLAALLLEFRDPKTPAEVFGAIDAEIEEHEFAELVEGLQRRGLLVGATTPAIREFLNPVLFDEPATMARIEATLKAGRVCIIANAFAEKFAEEVRSALDGYQGWVPHGQHGPFFGYHHHNIYDRSQFPAALSLCEGVLSSTASKELIQNLSGVDCSGRLQLSASLYLAGDYSLPHDDAIAPRTVAFVWHLTKEWEPAWGGHFFWCAPPTAVCPAYNTLILFNVAAERSYHFVEQVAPIARGKRLTVNGWWTSRECGASLTHSPPDATLAREPACHPAIHVRREGPGVFSLEKP